ncbi:unnamed protein product [Pleuronectes platessa]|uniref:Uncharacterized protein n=1 Tax=Pleuronectes platessa TaxID=8262 RepID=A0A9N7VUQ4_PLEPL|nr:unnamed protein product [Pleuronectes platessa]
MRTWRPEKRLVLSTHGRRQPAAVSRGITGKLVAGLEVKQGPFLKCVCEYRLSAGEPLATVPQSGSSVHFRLRQFLHQSSASESARRAPALGVTCRGGRAGLPLTILNQPGAGSQPDNSRSWLSAEKTEKRIIIAGLYFESQLPSCVRGGSHFRAAVEPAMAVRDDPAGPTMCCSF